MEAQPLLLFDGVCNLCNRSVQFVIRHDQKRIFRFAPLQGEAARKALADAGLQLAPGGATLASGATLATGATLAATAADAAPSNGAAGADPGSVLLLYQGKLYSRSSAVLKVLELLGGPWKASRLLYVIPTPLRNKLYDWVARNRYRWFGKKEECMIPTPDLKSRFLEESPAGGKLP